MLTNLINKIKDFANNNKFYTESGDERGHNLDDSINKEDGDLIIIKNDLINNVIDFIFSNPKEYEDLDFFEAIFYAASIKCRPIGSSFYINLLLAKRNKEYLKMLGDLNFSKIDRLTVSWGEYEDENVDSYIDDLKNFLEKQR